MVADRLTDVAGQFLNMRLEKLGYIHEDSAVIKAIRQQKPFILSYPKSKATNCITHIRNKLANIPERPRGLLAFWKRLFNIEDEEIDFLRGSLSEEGV
jgi:flagellar biosynthesis protein FlhG